MMNSLPLPVCMSELMLLLIAAKYWSSYIKIYYCCLFNIHISALQIIGAMVSEQMFNSHLFMSCAFVSLETL